MINNQLFTIVLPLAFLLGACVGSFVTMASYRLPLDQEIVFKPSHCPHCAATLTVRDLFPLLSWILARGRCRHCHAPVSARYPLIELALGIAFAALVFCYGISFKTLLLLLLVTELAILIVTDLEHTIIPDGVQIAMFFTGILWCIRSNADWVDVTISASLGLGLGLALHYGYKWLRKKDGLGWADVKFLGVAGVWLPLAAFVPFLFFSGLMGTLTGLLWQVLKRGPIFPFGPALAVSLFINVLFPDLLARL
jgi:prepilin signal peptidase PulO-like enzyme (type II secretory pathway)